jgi:hypothetical protein
MTIYRLSKFLTSYFGTPKQSEATHRNHENQPEGSARNMSAASAHLSLSDFGVLATVVENCGS